MPLAPVLLQLAAAAAPGAGPLPDIEFRARVQAKEVRIEQRGEARLEVRADPPLVEDVTVQRNQPPGPTRLRNLDVRLDARATLADPRAGAPAPTESPEPATPAPPG